MATLFESTQMLSQSIQTVVKGPAEVCHRGSEDEAGVVQGQGGLRQRKPLAVEVGNWFGHDELPKNCALRLWKGTMASQLRVRTGGHVHERPTPCLQRRRGADPPPGREANRLASGEWLAAAQVQHRWLAGDHDGS